MYIDPGSGSILLQIILGSVLGAGVLIKVFWKKILSLFGKKESDSREASNHQQ